MVSQTLKVFSFLLLSSVAAFAVDPTDSHQLLLSANGAPITSLNLSGEHITGTLGLGHLPTGTGSGQLILGGDPRLQGTAWSNLVADGITDCTTQMQVYLNTLSATNSVALLPPGRFRVHTGYLNINSPVRMQGGGAGSVSNVTGNGSQLDQGFVPGGTTFVTSDLTGSLITQNVSGCSFSAFALFHDRANGAPTAGAGILGLKTTESHYEGLVVVGFYDNINIVNGYSQTYDKLCLDSPVRSSLHIADTIIPDGGDPSISGCTFGFYIYGGSAPAAIYQESGGGAKISNCKFNGGAGKYDHAIWLNIPDGVGTSDLIVHGNSFENLNDWAIYGTQAGPIYTGGFGNIQLSANQISLGGGGLKLIGSAWPGVTVSSGQFCALSLGSFFFGPRIGPGGVPVTDSNVIGPISIGLCHHYFNTGPVIVNNTASANVHIHPQDVDGIATVYTGTNDKTLGAFDYQWVGPTVSPNASAAMVRLGCLPYNGGVIEFSATGSVDGVGSFTIVGKAIWNYEAGGTGTIGTATVISTTKSGPGSASVALGFVAVAATSTIPAQIVPTLTSSNGATISPRCATRIDGPVSLFSFGP